MNSTNSAGESTEFNHPFLQSSFTFLGEFFCLGAFLISVAYKVYIDEMVVKCDNYKMHFNFRIICGQGQIRVN